jgi:TRAP-type C4-dicarboxylate transport system permease small subunit
MVEFSGNRFAARKQRALAWVMAGLVLVAFAIFAYHSTRYAGRSMVMRARCPVCALASYDKAAFELPQIQIHFGSPVSRLLSIPLFYPGKPQFSFDTIRGPPTFSISA